MTFILVGQAKLVDSDGGASHVLDRITFARLRCLLSDEIRGVGDIATTSLWRQCLELKEIFHLGIDSPAALYHPQRYRTVQRLVWTR